MIISGKSLQDSARVIELVSREFSENPKSEKSDEVLIFNSYPT